MPHTFLTEATFIVAAFHQEGLFQALTRFLPFTPPEAETGPAPADRTHCADALEALGFEVETDLDDVLFCRFKGTSGPLENDCFGDDPVYRAVAPFLEDGSCFAVETEGWWYRVYIRDGDYEWYEGRLVYAEPGSLALLGKNLKAEVENRLGS